MKHTTRRKLIIPMLILVLVTLVLFSLGRIAYRQSEKPTGEIRIAAIVPEGTIQMKIWNDVWAGIRKASEELGVSLSEYPYAAGKPASLLTSLLETASLSQVDGILLCGNMVNDPEVKRVMKEAREKGIRIVLCESDNSPDYRDAFLGFDNTQVGRTVANLLAGKNLDRVLLVTRTSGVSATAHVQRVEGLLETLQQLQPDLPVDTPEISETGIRFTYAMEDLLLSYAQESLGIVSFISSQTVQMAEMLENLHLGDKTIFIGFDEGEDTDAFLASDTVDVLITQDYDQMGETGLRVLQEIITGQEIPEDTIYLDPLFLTKNSREGQ